MRTQLWTSTGMLAVLGLALATGPASAGILDAETAKRLEPVVPAAIEYYNERSDDGLPALNGGQIDALLDGEVVRIRRRSPGDAEDPPERVTGYRIVPLPREKVWVAALDPAFRATSLLTEHRLTREADGSALWHQYLSLPWPIADRQWVIAVGVKTALARDTDGLIWEQTWKLAEGGEQIARASVAAGNLEGITEDVARDAVYVPANEGSWVLFRLEDSVTLVGYRVIARVGGNIPDSWIATFGMAQLEGVLDSVAEHARDAAKFYDPEVYPIVGGEGQVVGRF